MAFGAETKNRNKIGVGRDRKSIYKTGFWGRGAEGLDSDWYASIKGGQSGGFFSFDSTRFGLNIYAFSKYGRLMYFCPRICTSPFENIKPIIP